MQRRQAWEILYDLSSFTHASFDAVKLLRSQRLVDDEVYAIIRLSFCLEEPLKTRVRNLLKRVAHYRQMTWPESPTSMSFFTLSVASIVCGVSGSVAQRYCVEISPDTCSFLSSQHQCARLE